MQGDGYCSSAGMLLKEMCVPLTPRGCVKEDVDGFRQSKATSYQRSNVPGALESRDSPARAACDVLLALPPGAELPTSLREPPPSILPDMFLSEDVYHSHETCANPFTRPNDRRRDCRRSKKGMSCDFETYIF